MQRILYVHSRKASFIEIDRALIAERFEIEDLYQPGRFANPLKVLAAVHRCDAIVGWWASWHTFWPFTLGWLMRKPSLLIVGGFDVANMPEIGYGFQQGGARKWLSRWVIHRATRLFTNSFYSQREIEQNVGLPPERVPVVYHGVPDPFADSPPTGRRERVALCVGIVTRDNLWIKGQKAFVEAAAKLPEVRFVLAGKVDDDPEINTLRAAAAANVEFAGWVEQDALENLFLTAGAYVQPSYHEGFGVAVAEAMLGGCVPVVTHAGALPEVVGDAGVTIESREPEAVARGVERALELGEEGGRQARARILENFSLDVRRKGLNEQLDLLVGVEAAGGGN